MTEQLCAGIYTLGRVAGPLADRHGRASRSEERA